MRNKKKKKLLIRKRLYDWREKKEDEEEKTNQQIQSFKYFIKYWILKYYLLDFVKQISFSLTSYCL